MFSSVKSCALKATFAVICFVYTMAVVMIMVGFNLKKTTTGFHSRTQWTQLANSSVEIDSNIDVEAELRRRLELASEKKFILFWHRPHWMRVTEGSKSKRELCGNCELTLNRSKINDPRTGAILFPYYHVQDNKMPRAKNRNSNQLHILWQLEPPTHFKPEVIECKYIFNATASYRRQSDFFQKDHLSDIQFAKRKNISKSFIIERKTKLALSMISNCQSNPGAKARMKILRRMQDLGFAMDGYGRCFNNFSFPRGSNVEKLIQHYKFYMSFENSYHCRDYITEKALLNGLKFLTVPVVWGATKEDYEAIMPKGSYIFAEDFDTLESLVDYLNYLDGDDAAYLNFFDWYQMDLAPGSVPGIGRLCQICRAIHGINYDDRHRPDYDVLNPRIPTFTKDIARRVSLTVKSYIFGEENDDCLANTAENWNFYKRWKL